MPWAQSDAAGLSGGVTCDRTRDQMRRHLEQILYAKDFDKEVAVKSVNNLSDGQNRGLTTAPSNKEVLRFSSQERRERGEFTAREASYSARQQCRFHSDKPMRARTRSSTPDAGDKSRYSDSTTNRAAAGVASNSPSR